MEVNKDKNLIDYNFVAVNKKVEPLVFYFVKWNLDKKCLINFLRRKAYKKSKNELLKVIGIHGFENNFGIYTKYEYDEMERMTVEILKKKEEEKKLIANVKVKENKESEPKPKKKRTYKRKKKL